MTWILAIYLKSYLTHFTTCYLAFDLAHILTLHLALYLKYYLTILLGINSIEYRTWAYDSIEMKLVGQFLL